MSAVSSHHFVTSIDCGKSTALNGEVDMAKDSAGGGPDFETSRREFLLRMYDQMFNDIDRHIKVVWQSVAVLLAAFAVFTLVEKQIISMDVASSLIVGLTAWLIAHVYDSSYWYNRNLVIIANIERQFLRQDDLRHIHYYFGAHRENMAMLTQLRIQWWLGFGVGALVMLYHFLTRILPALSEVLPSLSARAMTRLLPYATAVAAVVLISMLRNSRQESYKTFLKNSPGIPIDTSGITYGTGHPPAG